MIRCKDIAAMVGVSRPAVTAVLNGSRPNCVSREKREKIFEIAARYNYRPNHAATVLKTGKSNLIGIVMPPWDNPYSAELCMALQQSLTAKNYTPFFLLDNHYNPVPGNFEQLLSLQVAGMITVASELMPDNVNIPVVSYFHDDPRFDSVCTNAQLTVNMYMEYLEKCGHQKIGYLGWLSDRRVKLLAAEAERRGMEFHERWQIGASNSTAGVLYPPGGDNPFEQLLKINEGKDLPTALIIHNDTKALKILRHIRNCGYRVPEDFSVIAHDNISQSVNSIPALTTISCGSSAMIAEIMVDLLMKRIAVPDRPREKVLLKPELIERESVLCFTEKQQPKESVK